MKTRRSETVYIAGPMSFRKDTDWNYPAFHRAAVEWRAAGWRVLNPAESFSGRTHLPYERYMRNAVKLVMKSSAIALLPQWQISAGACMEVLIGVRQGYEFYDANSGVLIPTPILNVSVMDNTEIHIG